jgi:mono/diheme cytochrome c family protein
MCASCHGADGHGSAAKATTLKIDAKLLDLGRAEAKGISRAEKRTILVDGKGKMPGYGKKVAAEEIDPLLDYSLGLVAAKPAAPPPAAAAPPPPAAATPPAAAAPPAKPAPVATDAKTKALWTSRCASCHGASGAGKATAAKKLKLPAATLDLGRPEAAGLTRDELVTIITSGKDKMPAFGKKLKAAQIEKLGDHSQRLAAARRK